MHVNLRKFLYDKKRIPNHENPVYIVENITFLEDKLDMDIKQYIDAQKLLQKEKPVEKTGFEKILSLLYESKIAL